MPTGREGEVEAAAMLRIANAIGGAIDDITSPHWRRLLVPLRERLCAAAQRRRPGRAELSLLGSAPTSDDGGRMD
jgi:hypothetical protein